ncbi:hypothetical protein [Enterococcus ratti]|uniref:hypothetical protein n=1 Tax=Enterococcus ratti TaxID=150033 RepID=UPI0009004757|nr:hypothetical protein [Enterococcus ratti]
MPFGPHLACSNYQYTSTFGTIVQALIATNAGIFITNQNYLNGKIKVKLVECSFDSAKNRIEYDSNELLP